MSGWGAAAAFANQGGTAESLSSLNGRKGFFIRARARRVESAGDAGRNE